MLSTFIIAPPPPSLSLSLSLFLSLFLSCSFQHVPVSALDHGDTHVIRFFFVCETLSYHTWKRGAYCPIPSSMWYVKLPPVNFVLSPLNPIIIYLHPAYPLNNPLHYTLSFLEQSLIKVVGYLRRDENKDCYLVFSRVYIRRDSFWLMARRETRYFG